VRLTLGDRVVAADHYTDWHRVERRRAAWEAQFAIPHQDTVLLE
jgi:hypothetical protein